MAMRSIFRGVISCLYVGLASCVSGPPAVQGVGPEAGLRSPADPLAAVRAAFNAEKGKTRFLAVLSPT